MTSITAQSTAAIDPSLHWLSRQPRVVVVVQLDRGLWVSFWKKKKIHSMNGEERRERVRENVFMVSDCRLHPAA